MGRYRYLSTLTFLFMEFASVLEVLNSTQFIIHYLWKVIKVPTIFSVFFFVVVIWFWFWTPLGHAQGVLLALWSGIIPVGARDHVQCWVLN